MPITQFKIIGNVFGSGVATGRDRGGYFLPIIFLNHTNDFQKILPIKS